MKKILFIAVSTLFLFSACEKDDDNPSEVNGKMEIEFDNIAIVNQVQRQLNMTTEGDTNYDYQNAMGQDFNITLLRYFISEIVLEGPNGERFEDVLAVDATDAKGYYLVDESVTTSQLIALENIPAGEYNKISFTVGVAEDGVKEGAAGGSLDPATNGMFWNWNAGYVALKFEGQSLVSPGGAVGNTIAPDNTKGIVYHVGGWKEIEGTAFVNNNQSLSYTFDVNAKVGGEQEPHVHMVFDILSMLSAKNKVDFAGNNSVHKPVDGQAIAENLAEAFRFDHIHQ